MTRPLTDADDRHHEVGDPHPMWTETTWWGFLVPDRALGGMIYTLFRPNLGVASLLVAVWDAEATEPWLVPYHRSQWHLPFPGTDLDDTEVGGLRLRCREPLRSYDLTYSDGDALSLHLRFDAVMEPHVPIAEREAGHFDQLCRVTGASPLPERRSRWTASRSATGPGTCETTPSRRRPATCTAPPTRATSSWRSPSRAERPPRARSSGGYLLRDGEKAALTAGTRTVVSRRRGHPDEVTLEATDALGRDWPSSGRVTASMASQSTPGMFAWMSIADWTIDGRPGHGEDHDVWSPDRLAHRPAGAPMSTIPAPRPTSTRRGWTTCSTSARSPVFEPRTSARGSGCSAR